MSPAPCPVPWRNRAIPSLVFLPCYRRAWSAGVELVTTGLTLQIPIGARSVEGHVSESRLPGSDVRVYLIDQPGYFDRDGLYGTGTHRLRRQLRALRLLRSRRAGDDPAPAPAARRHPLQRLADRA